MCVGAVTFRPRHRIWRGGSPRAGFGSEPFSHVLFGRVRLAATMWVAGFPRCFRMPGNFLGISTSNMIQDYDPVQLWSVLVRYFLHADPYNVIFWYGWVRKWTILPRLVCIPGTLKVGWRHTPTALSSLGFRRSKYQPKRTTNG